MKKMNHVLSVTLSVLAVLLLTGCWEKDNPVRTSLNVDTSTLTLAVGESATRTTTTKAQWDYQITYTSSNPAVATVDQTGKVTAVSEGEAVITVSMAETIKSWYAAATRSYNVVVKKLSISGAVAINAANGYSGRLTAPDGVAVTWSSNHPEILSVDANGNLTFVSVSLAGADVTITGTSKSNPSVSDSMVINVSPQVGMIIADNSKVYTPNSYDASYGKKVAIVAYKGAAGTADKSDGSSGYVGLAIALTDANNGANCKWYTTDAGPCVAHCCEIVTAIGATDGFGKGIDNTNTLADGCGASHDHAAAKVAKNFQYDASVAAGVHPTGTSQWFLPTMYHWNLIVKGMCGNHGDLSLSNNDNYNNTNFNVKITAAGGTGVLADVYWSCDEGGAGNTWSIYFNNGDASLYSKSYSHYVRPVLAF